MSKSNRLMILLSVWGILLVVLGHSGFEEPIIAENLRYLHKWIYSFHMPLFFFISGYLYSFTNSNFLIINKGEFLNKKVLRLMVPYIVLGVVVWMIKYCFQSLSHASRDFGIESFLLMFFAPQSASSTMGYLWYIFSLFCVFVITTVLAVLGIDLRKGLCGFIFIALSWILSVILPKIVFLNLSGVLWYFPFFIIGIYYNKYECQFVSFKSVSKAFKVCMCVIFFVMTIVCLFLDCSNFFNRFLISVLSSLLGILFSLCLCYLLLDVRFVECKMFFMSDKTYSIYLLSWFGQYSMKILVVNILNLHWIVCVFMMFISGVMVPLFICRIIDKVKILSKCKSFRLIVGY